MVSQPGTELKRSKYRLLGLVGQGQFGQVFCAVHRQTGRLVALKNLDRQRFPTNKFLRELRFLLSLQHPHIVTCQALEHTPTGRYLVMDYCEGGTLRNLMTAENRLSLSHSLKLIADILAGLEHAHSRGIVHCDIKPENILLTVEPEGWTAKISDLGIARLSQEMTNQDLGNTGSPAYMAPERFYGQYSPSSDLYSIGIILFEMLAGYRPFSGTPTELMSAHLNRPVKLPDTIPAAWQPIIITALQKLSARRFRSAGEMLTALQTVAATEGSGSWLDPQASRLPLLQSTSLQFPALQSTTPLQVQSQELLRHPLTLLAVSPPSHHPAIGSASTLYRAGVHQLTLQTYATSVLSPPSLATSGQAQPEVQQIAPLKTAIRALFPCFQGCFVVTQDSLHWVPPGVELNANFASRAVLRFSPGSLVAIDPSGKWAATLTLDPNSTVGKLQFHALPTPTAAVGLPSQPIQVNLGDPAPACLQLLALDSRHVALLMDLPSGQRQRPKSRDQVGTKIQVITRRGTPSGLLTLPVKMGTASLTATAYQLLAADRQNPGTILTIDLKPYRINRFGVSIQPDFLMTTSWGYILATKAGQIVVLDREGLQIGQLSVSAAISAITPIDPYGLLVATWDGQQALLKIADLRQSEIDLLF